MAVVLSLTKHVPESKLNVDGRSPVVKKRMAKDKAFSRLQEY
jgi:hypothetical protein